jgi:hypothetical protein
MPLNLTIRGVAFGLYRPGSFNAMTKPFFPEGYAGQVT